MYRWRRLTKEEQCLELSNRRKAGRPWHSPVHIDGGPGCYLVTAACYEHVPVIGHTLERMSQFSERLLETIAAAKGEVEAWVVLPNHYHLLVSSEAILVTLKELGKLHGKSSFEWNGQEELRGRKVWFNALETRMKSADHRDATLNYIHHNPVKHGYVAKWTDWPWSSARQYLDDLGREKAREQWRKHPIENYGVGWDEAVL